MFGQWFGKKLGAAQAPSSPPPPVDPAQRRRRSEETVFSPGLWQGEAGGFLREHGFAPDDPRNVIASQEPVAEQLADGLADVRRVTNILSATASYPLGALHLLPPGLWRTRFGSFLLHTLDLSPYRPWNTILLPIDERGRQALGLPLLPKSLDEDVPENLEIMIEVVADIFRGKSGPEGEAATIMFKGVRSNFPFLFPLDTADLSGNVREARANVRALAFSHAVTSGLVEKETIIKSHKTFLGHPEIQLTN